MKPIENEYTKVLKIHFELFQKYKSGKKRNKSNRAFFIEKHFPGKWTPSSLSRAQKVFLIRCLQNKNDGLGCCVYHPIPGKVQDRERAKLVGAKALQWVKDLKERIREGKESCAYCHSKENLTLDHIVPVSQGGKSEETNIQILCSKCNYEKADSIPPVISTQPVSA